MELTAALVLLAEPHRGEDDASPVLGGDRAVERRQQDAVAADARVVGEPDGALDPGADCSSCAGGIADPILAAVGPDDDVVTLVAQVEVEEMLEPHLAPGTLPEVSPGPGRSPLRGGDRALPGQPRALRRDAEGLSQRPRA